MTLLLASLVLEILYMKWGMEFFNQFLPFSLVFISLPFGIDFYLFAVAIVVAGRFRQAQSAGLFRDLCLTGCSGSELISPWFWTSFALLLIGGMFVNLIALAANQDAPAIFRVHLIAGLIALLLSTWFTSSCLITMNSIRVWLPIQLVCCFAISFMAALAVYYVAELLTPILRGIYDRNPNASFFQWTYPGLYTPATAQLEMSAGTETTYAIPAVPFLGIVYANTYSIDVATLLVSVALAGLSPLLNLVSRRAVLKQAAE